MLVIGAKNMLFCFERALRKQEKEDALNVIVLGNNLVVVIFGVLLMFLNENF